MSEERYRRADEILDAALDLDGDSRTLFVQNACGDDDDLRRLVARLLDGASDEESLVPGGAIDGLPDDFLTGALEEPDLTGVIVDRYRVLHELGRGGMAIVYKAERADGQFEQFVALKLVKHGIASATTVRRFEQERQILASIRHPHIARLLDGGTMDDGRPYFAMEWIDGIPIDRFVEERELGQKDRLRLFLDVAEAVALAHRNLVVHRDIKPSNTLVTEDGDAKLLDFGIARLLEHDDQLTQTTDRVMTPLYASPEQLRGEPVTTASDIYQLGVLLYQIITGALPYDETSRRGSGGLMQAICELPPLEPQGVDRDLTNILSMALRKEPERRYATVDAFVRDVRAYLGGEAVSARGDGVAYKTSKFVRRHLAAVTILGGAIALFLALIIFYTQRLADERDAALEAQFESDQVADFLIDLFMNSDPGRAGIETLTAREILDRGADQIGIRLKDRPLVRARILSSIGSIYTNLAVYDRAQPLLEEALRVRRDEVGSNHALSGLSMTELAWVHELKGELDVAEPMYRDALEIMRSTHGAESTEVAVSLNNLGSVLVRQERFDEAGPLFQEAVSLFGDVELRWYNEKAAALNNLATWLQERDDLAGAEPLFREALELNAIALGEEHPEYTTTMNNFALLLKQRGKYEEALPLYRRAVEIDRQMLGREHPNYAVATNNLADLLSTLGRHEEAEPFNAEALHAAEAALPSEHWLVALFRANHGVTLGAIGRHTEGLERLRAGHAGLLASLGAEHERTLKAAGQLAELERAAGGIVTTP